MQRRVNRQGMVGPYGVRYSWVYWAVIAAAFALLVLDFRARMRRRWVRFQGHRRRHVIACRTDGGQHEQHRRDDRDLGGGPGAGDHRHEARGPDVARLGCRSDKALLPEPRMAAGRRLHRRGRHPGRAVHAAPLTVLDPLRQGPHGSYAGVRGQDHPGGHGHRRRPKRSRQPRRRRQRGVREPAPGLRVDRRALVLHVRVVHGPGWQRLAAPRGHDPDPRAGMGGLTWTSPPWQICCMRRPSVTARSRRSLHRTIDGTGTRRTWTLARAEALRTRPPTLPGATWRRSSTSWSDSHG